MVVLFLAYCMDLKACEIIFISILTYSKGSIFYVSLFPFLLDTPEIYFYHKSGFLISLNLEEQDLSYYHNMQALVVMAW